MNSVDKLAMLIADMHKANLNPPATAPRIGIVVSSNPLRIQWGSSVLLESDRIVLPDVYVSGIKIPNRYMNTNGQMVDEEMDWKLELSLGDRVAIVPDEYLKQWYVLWKAGGV